jgi:hypothetical protein
VQDLGTPLVTRQVSQNSIAAANTQKMIFLASWLRIEAQKMPLKSVLSGAPGRLRNETSVSRISIDSVIDTMHNVTPVF